MVVARPEGLGPAWGEVRLDCNEVMEQLAEYLDEDAAAELRKAIDEHLETCHDCSYYVDTVRKTIVLYQADRRTVVPMKVTVRLQAALAAEYAHASGRGPARPD